MSRTTYKMHSIILLVLSPYADESIGDQRRGFRCQ